MLKPGFHTAMIKCAEEQNGKLNMILTVDGSCDLSLSTKLQEIPSLTSKKHLKASIAARILDSFFDSGSSHLTESDLIDIFDMWGFRGVAARIITAKYMGIMK